MPTLMVQGCTSDAGKTLVAAGLCRFLARRGVAVAPFKPQNMALNSAVTADGGEIGRAQALQAQACGLPAHTDMNPILLKPSSDCVAQVIVHGKARRALGARAYHGSRACRGSRAYRGYKKVAMEAVLQSYQRLAGRFSHIIVEGAGSPAEINLRENDIANMGFAEAVDCEVVLVADINRGGVFAHLVGTLALLSESERARVRGFIINQFRGERALLQGGVEWLEKRTGKPVLGVLPYLPGLHLDAEDALVAEQRVAAAGGAGALKVAVLVFSRISNHTDFDALRLHPQVDFRYVAARQAIPPCDLIILPGSKNVRADLAELRANGWHDALEKHLRYGGRVLGICGGYQMLGKRIADPLGVEDVAGECAGLGWLDIDTELRADKNLQEVEARLNLGVLSGSGSDGEGLGGGAGLARGYFIHCGETRGAGLRRPFMRFASGVRSGEGEGAVSEDGCVVGTYLHGLFDGAHALGALLRWAGLAEAQELDRNALREEHLERLADWIEADLDCAYLFGKVGCDIAVNQ